MQEVPVNCLGGLSLPGKSVVRLTDRPDMTLDVYRGRKTTTTTTIRSLSVLYSILFYPNNFANPWGTTDDCSTMVLGNFRVRVCSSTLDNSIARADCACGM